MFGLTSISIFYKNIISRPLFSLRELAQAGMMGQVGAYLSVSVIFSLDIFDYKPTFLKRVQLELGYILAD